jgi:hypothetical protein
VREIPKRLAQNIKPQFNDNLKMDILQKKNQTTQIGDLGNRFVNPLLHTKFMSDSGKAHGLTLTLHLTNSGPWCLVRYFFSLFPGTDGHVLVPVGF